MENADRENILNNIDALVANTAYDELLALCIENKLIYEEMKAELEVCECS